MLPKKTHRHTHTHTHTHSLIHTHTHTHTHSHTKLNGPGNYKSERKVFLAVGKACMAIFCPPQHLK